MSLASKAYDSWVWLRKEILSQSAGKVAFALLLALVIISVYAAITMPPDYNRYWNVGVYWRHNPKNAPPEWVSSLGYACVTHRSYDLRLAEPVQVSEGAGRLDISYNLTYDLGVKDYPQGVKVSVNIGVPQGVRNLRLVLNLIKPDGVTLRRLIDYTADFINTSVLKVDFDELGGLTLAMLEAYRDLVSRIDINEISLRPSKYLFGALILTDNREVAVTPLQGRYVFNIQLSFRVDGVSSQDILKYLRRSQTFLVVVVGTCYGIMGTDYQGRDLAEGLFYGFPIALVIGLLVALISSAIGVIAGLVSGYYGGFIDELIQRFVDILGSIPLLPILILVGKSIQVTYTGENKPLIMLATIFAVLIVFSWGGLAIVIRSMTLSLKSELYVEAAKAVGASNMRIISKHILPQLVPYIAASLVYSTPNAIITEAGLSVLGIQHGFPTWGNILSEARLNGTMAYWWWILPPGFLIAIVSLTFVLLGLSLEKVVEPRLKR
ncbi:MAG: ABC transporter permease [Zestosphaera sp.]